MADTVLLEQITKLGDLPIEEKEQIRDGLIFGLKAKSEFYERANKVKLDANRTSYTYRRNFTPELDKTSSMYVNGLQEGITPDAEQLTIAEYTVGVKAYGRWYGFTDRMLKHSYDDLKAAATKNLTNIAVKEVDEHVADVLFTSAATITGLDLVGTNGFEALQTISRQLYLNGAEQIDGYYNLVVDPVLADKILSKYKDIITHTSEKEAIIKGEIGYLSGLRIIRSKTEAFKGGKWVAYGLTPEGIVPFSVIEYSNQDEIIFKPLGSLGGGEKGDPLNQRGSIGLKRDGAGYFINDDTCIIHGTQASVDAWTKTQDAEDFKYSNQTAKNPVESSN